MISNRRCPECGGEMVKHEFSGRVYYVCRRCRKEMVIPAMALI